VAEKLASVVGMRSRIASRGSCWRTPRQKRQKRSILDIGTGHCQGDWEEQMNPILKDLSAGALVGAVKANLFEWYRYVGSSPKAELHDSPELTWLITGISSSFVNGVLRTEAEPDNADGIIKDTLAHFQLRDVPRWSWWTEPGTRPADLGRRLVTHGFSYTDRTPGMAVDLSRLNEDLPAPADLVIAPVDDRERLSQWAYASIIGFGYSESDVEIWFDVFAGLGFELPLRSYVGILQGEVIAASQLFLGAGVAGIYVVATLPEARRLGVGAAMTLAPLQEARAMGYRMGILHSSEQGEGVYRRLGFRE
jgi:ribosomal protein S18 acetylase RimI-like enzyme